MENTILQWLEEASVAVAIRQSTWQYPFLEIVHIIGIALLVGPAIMFDLRLLGFSKNLPVSNLAQHLLPWSRRALLLIIPSGLLLFITNASTLGGNPVFLVKLVLLVLAGINALLFHRFIFTRFVKNSEDRAQPAMAKVTAVISIVSWLLIIACGRLLAYE